MRREIEITIGEDGVVQITTHGYKGPSCLDAVRPLEEALGEVINREMTAEYYERETGQSTQRTRGR